MHIVYINAQKYINTRILIGQLHTGINAYIYRHSRIHKHTHIPKHTPPQTHTPIPEEEYVLDAEQIDLIIHVLTPPPFVLSPQADPSRHHGHHRPEADPNTADLTARRHH